MDSEHDANCLPCIRLSFRRKQRSQDSKKEKLEQSLSNHTPNDKFVSAGDPQTAGDVNENQTGPPDATAYVFEATKKTIDVLKSVAGITGVPLLEDVLDIGLRVIDLCEGINQVRERVAELRNRVAEFLLVTTKFMKKPANQAIAGEIENFLEELTADIEGDLSDLKRCLDMINGRLQRIRDQNIILTTLLPDANISEIEHCETLLQDAIDRFQTLRGLRASEDLARIQTQLEQIHHEMRAMHQKVDHIDDKLGELKSSVDELKARVNSSETAPVIPMPNPPPVFYGRTELVDNIATMLCSRQQDVFPRICLLGTGGLGKTSVALAVMRHASVKRVFEERKFWVDCTSAPSPSALIGVLAKSMGVTQQSSDMEGSIFARLASSGSCVLLLDNFETPWHNNCNRPIIEKLLQQIDTFPHVAILLTMRSEYPPLQHWYRERLDAVALADSRQIYTAIRHETLPASSNDTQPINDPILDQLLDAVGHLPYAVSLLATLASRSGASPAELLQQWQAKGTAVLDRMDDCISLSVESAFVQSSEGAEDLLRVLSMLPAGTCRSHLKLWISSPSLPLQAISTLRDAALLSVGPGDDPTLFVLPVVQSYMQNNIPLELRLGVHHTCCRILREHEISIDGPNDPRFATHADFIRSEEHNIEVLLTRILEFATSPSPSDQTIQVTTDYIRTVQIFLWYQLWMKPYPALAETLVEATVLSNDIVAQAESLLALGKILDQVGRYREACNKLLRARELFRRVEKEGGVTQYRKPVVLCSLLVHRTEMFLEPGSEIVDSLRRLEEDCRGDDFLEGFRLQCLGRAQLTMGQSDDSLESLTASRELSKRLGRSLDVAACHIFMSQTFGQLGRYEDALDALDDAISIVRGLKYDVPLPFLFKVGALKLLNRPEEVVLKALHLAHSHRDGSPLTQAAVLEEYGEVYVKQGDWKAAVLAYEEARKAALLVDDIRARRGIPERCEKNIKCIHSKWLQGDWREGAFAPPPRLATRSVMF